MPIGSDARFPLNADPNIVPAQPAMRMLVNLPAAAPTVTVSPTAAPTGSVWSFLQSLFGGGAAPSPGPALGMRGLLQTPRGRGAPGADALGNPMGRF